MIWLWLVLLTGFYLALWRRAHDRLNWWLLLAPWLVINWVLWRVTGSVASQWLALFYAVALALYISRRLWHGYLTLTLSEAADLQQCIVPKGTEFVSHSGVTLITTRSCRLCRWRLWWAKWRGQPPPRQLIVPVREVTKESAK